MNGKEQSTRIYYPASTTPTDQSPSYPLAVSSPTLVGLRCRRHPILVHRFSTCPCFHLQEPCSQNGSIYAAVNTDVWKKVLLLILEPALSSRPPRRVLRILVVNQKIWIELQCHIFSLGPLRIPVDSIGRDIRRLALLCPRIYLDTVPAFHIWRILVLSLKNPTTSLPITGPHVARNPSFNPDGPAFWAQHVSYGCAKDGQLQRCRSMDLGSTA